MTADPPPPWTAFHEAVIAPIVWGAIAAGLAGRRAAPPIGGPAWLSERRATFVTLTADGDLRGCIGTLDAVSPLGASIATNTHSAAFGDPRFAPVERLEWPALHAEVSVLSPPEPLAIADLGALLQALVPGRDGLVIRAGGRSATFLPAVWDQLPDPESFCAHLWRKAGLPARAWPADMQIFTYRADKVGAPRIDPIPWPSGPTWEPVGQGPKR